MDATRVRSERGWFGIQGRLKWLRMPRRGLLGGVLQVTAAVLPLLLCSGYLRGSGLDERVQQGLTWLDGVLREQIAFIIRLPVVVTLVAIMLRYAALATVLFLLANYLWKVPCYFGFVVLSEFQRRQGDNLARLKLLLGLSMAMALVLCLVCHGQASLYAWFHFVVGYVFLRLTNDPSRMNRSLDWHARIRTGLDNSLEDMTEDEGES